MTEMVDCPTDAKGTMTTIVLDDDTRLTLTNPQVDLKPSVVYRCLADYVIEDDGKATLYGLRSCPILRDSTDLAKTDPLGVVSLWRTRRYINLHLMPKTQDKGTHGWGFITDSIRVEGSKSYYRFYERDTPSDAWRAVTVDLAKA